MNVTKKQITDGLVKFIDNMIPQCKDKQTSLILLMSKDMLKKKSDMIDIFLDNPLVASAITEEDGMYNITYFVDSMRGILDDMDHPVVLPSIPLLAPDEVKFNVTAGDFERLISYIQPPAIDEE